MDELIKYYEVKSLRNIVVHKMKIHILIMIFILALSSIIIEQIFKEVNNFIRFCMLAIITFNYIFFILLTYIKISNEIIDKHKANLNGVNEIKLGNINIENKNFFKEIYNYERNLIKKYLIKNKLLKKDKICFIIDKLSEKRDKSNSILNLQTFIIIPLAISIGTNYFSNVNVEDAGVFIWYCLIYVFIVEIIISVIVSLIVKIGEIIRYPIIDKDTYKILGKILSDIYLEM